MSLYLENKNTSKLKEKYRNSNSILCLIPKYRIRAFSFPGIYKWAVPKGVASMGMRIWGGGGGGSSIDGGGNAGAGGAYLVFSHDVKEGECLLIKVGEGGIGTSNPPGGNGGDTSVEGRGWFAIAKGGQGAQSITAAQGGQGLLVGICEEYAINISGQLGGLKDSYDGPTGGGASGGGGIGFPYFPNFSSGSQSGEKGQAPGSGGGGGTDSTVLGGNGGRGQIEFTFIQIE